MENSDIKLILNLTPEIPGSWSTPERTGELKRDPALLRWKYRIIAVLVHNRLKDFTQGRINVLLRKRWSGAF